MENKKITLSVAGKFHALSLAKEFSKRDLLENIYCVSRSTKVPNNIPDSTYNNRIDLAWWQAFGTRIPFTGFSFNKRNQIFDEWVAKKITTETPSVIHGWNGSSFKTFKIASKLGWKCCIERSCPHNQFQYDLLKEEADTLGLYHHEDPDKLKQNIEELYMADTIICPSSYSASSYKDPELIKKICRVPLGGNYVYKDRAERSQSGLRILMVGNSFLRKGTNYLIEAMKFLESPDVELWIRGEIPDSYRQKIKDPRIKIFGAVSFEKLNELYLSADVFVQPSIDEGFGMTVMEALSYGLPLVVTDHVGAADVLNDKVAKKVPIRNSEALANAIIQAKELVNDNFDDERKSILKTYTWSLCSTRLLTEAYNIG